MTQDELLNLLHDLSTKEKIGQLLQLDAGFFRNDVSFETGSDTQYGFTKEDSALCGSVLNISGANYIKQIQESYIEQHPHRIPLLFCVRCNQRLSYRISNTACSRMYIFTRSGGISCKYLSL